ncbi:UPF0481 protein [Platanthera zijinensis]|uniref:UPF0481 protein n=1 Tax=Platanthera zijinensis TaxID=2320716 RepID=A0AAP0ATI5_9ASPA
MISGRRFSAWSETRRFKKNSGKTNGFERHRYGKGGRAIGLVDWAAAAWPENQANDGDSTKELELWRKHSIYRVPACIKELNPKAYRPQVVSFGPYHHGADELSAMEEHKHRALRHLLRRANKPLEELADGMEELVNPLQSSYFLRLMVVDGCFLLEILRLNVGRMADYAVDDPIFSNHGMLHTLPYIKRDMLIVENQLPLLVLEKLVALETGIIRSAVELYEAGIRFKTSRTNSLHDIRFHHGILSLPAVVVDDATQYAYLNLMAFERLHVGAGSQITSFVFFMDNIIDSSKDVALLHSKGIIQNALGSDKAVAKLFNSLSKDVTLDPDSSLDAVQRRVNGYCQKSWNKWRANLIHTYFRSPWAFLSLAAAIFLLALSVAQTIYTVMPYYQNEENLPSVPPPPPRMAPPPAFTPRRGP